MAHLQNSVSDLYKNLRKTLGTRTASHLASDYSLINTLFWSSYAEALFSPLRIHVFRDFWGGFSFNRSIHNIYRWIERLNKTSFRGAKLQYAGFFAGAKRKYFFSVEQQNLLRTPKKGVKTYSPITCPYLRIKAGYRMISQGL